MNKKVINILVALLLVFSSYASADYLIKFSNSQTKGMIPEASYSPLYSSCKEILDNGQSEGNGVYSINVNNKEFDVYCDMTSAGGGWTMVVAQFEQDPVTNWSEGVQADYNPSLSTSKGFALSYQELPEHTQTAFGRGFDPTFVGFSNFIYNTGNIDKALITNLKTGLSYHVHRNVDRYYESHDPESYTSTLSKWKNTLTFDQIGGFKFSWAFSPNHGSSQYRGYSLRGSYLFGSYDNFAWTVWVR
jgi:hypothetical protein